MIREERGVQTKGVTMKVMLTFYGEDITGLESSPQQIAATFEGWGAFDQATRAAGVLIACEGLEGGHAATTIRVVDGDRRVTDGPFMETKEQLGGFALLEVRDLDEEMAWAARTPWNGEGQITEIRPVMDYEQYAARLVGTGLIGAYTTFSTWMLETHLLSREGRRSVAVLNIALSLGLGLLAVWAGREIAAGF